MNVAQALTEIAAQPKRDWAGLIWTIVRTDFKARYHRTWFGFLWALAKPLAMMTTLLLVFSLIFSQHADFGLKLVVGLFLWEFFAEGSKVGLISLAHKGFLLGKTRFPSWVVVVTSLSNPLITLAVYSVGALIALAVLGKAPDLLMVLLYLYYVAQLALIVVGVSLGSSVLFLRYRDLNQVWEVLLSAGFFLTPVVFPLDVIPHRFQFWLYAWPPTPVIQFARMVLISGEVPSARANGMLALMSVGIFGLGLAIYRARAPRVAEQL